MIEGAGEAVAAFNARGYLVVIVTNQAGIARGYFGEEELHRFNTLILEELSKSHARVDAIYFCPFHRDAVSDAYRHADHPDRKPNAGMLLKAAIDHPIDLARSVMIGDQPTDMEAARKAGVSGYLFRGGNLLLLAEEILARQVPFSPTDQQQDVEFCEKNPSTL